MIVNLDLSVVVSTMKYDNGEDSLSSLLKLDQDKLPLLQVRAEAHRVD